MPNKPVDKRNRKIDNLQLHQAFMNVIRHYLSLELRHTANHNVEKVAHIRKPLSLNRMTIWWTPLSRYCWRNRKIGNGTHLLVGGRAFIWQQGIRQQLIGSRNRTNLSSHNISCLDTSFLF